MLYREIITVCSQIHTKHINTLCGQNGELLYVKPVVQYLSLICDKSVTTQKLAFLSYWYRKKRLQMHF